MKFESKSEEATKAWARELVEGHFSDLEKQTLVITLQGEMGAGKTQFAKGVAEALGVKRIVASPTYVLAREYPGEHGELVHIDCWRTPKIKPEELQLDSYLKSGTVVVVEWPEPLLDYLTTLKHIVLVKIRLEFDGESRIIERS